MFDKSRGSLKEKKKKTYVDLTTRSGLKKVHANFNVIYNRIDKAYQRDLGNYKIRGGIVGIFAKMCVDSILRNKLFEKGVILFARWPLRYSPDLFRHAGKNYAAPKHR